MPPAKLERCKIESQDVQKKEKVVLKEVNLMKVCKKINVITCAW